MENKVLQQFLDAGVIEIGDNDDKVKHLEASVIDLSKILNDNKKLIPAYVLVALDSNTDPNDPVFLQAEEVVKAHWKTLRQKFPETPRTLLNAIIFSSLYGLTQENNSITRVVYLTCSTYFQFIKSGRERDIIEKILLELKPKVEDQAIAEWSLKSEVPTFKLPALKASELAEPLTAASLESVINKFFADFKKTTNETISQSFKSMYASERRIKLLWWKETLFSFALSKSYRDCPPELLPIILPFDLIKMVPSITPISVDYILKETLSLVLTKTETQKKIVDLLKNMLTPDNKKILQTLMTGLDEYNGKLSLTSFLSHCALEKTSIKDLSVRTGISDKTQISEGDLAVGIFHDLLSLELVKN